MFKRIKDLLGTYEPVTTIRRRNGNRPVWAHRLATVDLIGRRVMIHSHIDGMIEAFDEVIEGFTLAPDQSRCANR